MSVSSNEKIEELIKSYQKVIDYLQESKAGETEEHNDAINAALSTSICCNACQAVSSICVPDASPSKCQGGCTITSFAF